MPEYHKAIDISNYSGVPTVEQFQQVKALGYDLVICGTQKPDITLKQLTNAAGAGLRLCLYEWASFPLVLTAGTIIAATRPIERMFLDCEEDTILTPEQVVADLSSLVPATMGIYTRKDWWERFTGNSDCCKDLPLWYAHYDGIENFDDFVPFGGWAKPFMKQYAENQTVAGILCDLNLFRE